MNECKNIFDLKSSAQMLSFLVNSCTKKTHKWTPSRKSKKGCLEAEEFWSGWNGTVWFVSESFGVILLNESVLVKEGLVCNNSEFE